jgi:hypothetical protein
MARRRGVEVLEVNPQDTSTIWRARWRRRRNPKVGGLEALTEPWFCPSRFRLTKRRGCGETVTPAVSAGTRAPRRPPKVNASRQATPWVGAHLGRRSPQSGGTESGIEEPPAGRRPRHSNPRGVGRSAKPRSSSFKLELVKIRRKRSSMGPEDLEKPHEEGIEGVRWGLLCREQVFTPCA